MTPAAATALACADRPAPELAGAAVARALERAGAAIARGVLLFLTEDFHRHTGAALAAAARAGQCLQVAGCTVPGVFTEEDYALDRPAAAALVLTGDGLALAAAGTGHAPRLAFATPQAVDPAWLAHGDRAGVLSADPAAIETGHVWERGKPVAEGRAEVAVRGARGALGVSRGVQPLGNPLVVTAVEGHDLLTLDGHAALRTLLRELPLAQRGPGQLPWHNLFAAVLAADTPTAWTEGRYELVPVIAGAGEEGVVTLAGRLAVGARIVWCMRQGLAAERDTRVALERASAELGGPAEFAVMFSCIGRGPYFFGGSDRDLDILLGMHRSLPVVGVYGAGEIAPLSGGSRIVQNSAVFALYRRA